MICRPWPESLPPWIDPATLPVFGLPPRDPNNDDDEEEDDEDETARQAARSTLMGLWARGASCTML